MRLLLPLLTLSLLACWAPQTSSQATPENSSTIHVVNHSGNHLTFYINNTRIGTVTRTEECLIVRWDRFDSSPQQYIIVKPTGESVFPLAPINLRSGSWKVEISPWPATRQFDALTIQPSPRCDVKAT